MSDLDPKEASLLYVELKDFRRELNIHASRLADRLKNIEDQVRQTNGRVLATEKDVLVLQTKWSVVVYAIVALAIPVLGLLIAWVK